MARIRTIKPEFFTSELIAECSPIARLLFVGLWCFSDDRGVHPASIKRLKKEVLPADDISADEVHKLVDELKFAGLLGEFEADGERFLYVTGWQKHQRIDKPTFRHPRPPSVSRFDECSSNSRRALDPVLELELDWKGMD